jgi:uncharacterized protein (DUF1499 family)
MKFIFGAIGFVIVMFFLLGLKSQKGKAKGLIDGRLAEPGAAPNAVCSEAGTQPEKLVAPLAGDFAQVKAAIIATGGTITAESERYISATYMSKVFKFIDDVELRKDSKRLWHIRSGSRVGYSDRGVNRRRVEAIRDALS